MKYKYKAAVYVRGAVTQSIYRNTLAGIEKAAIKELTRFEPGMGSLWPDRIEIFGVKTILYSEIPEDQHEWRKRQALHAQR